ncbi:MAG: phosphoribosylaminoimidazolesuccinocarboxamide synthase [Deltaproteobacteria bacterium RIFCSPLOWO2_01_44_7]|nr:MAG: phosphoribosylaminoimidazolesuccinocarboxamide synthase [Deltaproteobacteria bacterium RIFCSPHIGHO2_01_FULL_43_49]OGQ16399.1 MAG: phosphoribosylaminoimidazolesuccinocarboxamide synthase [Deltaproteobacteria bacterium RIFCSPHIGHO2_02_FULL_44_53]OGQ27775.1 MAG: phosphoribosylaminoimidazolesuccinocarboxamide synthase [Deltaproteobacteria bacterium RIFCSPHIGHO2_12_FULL_44_21]OGQ32917.1 MAG: phosphoribosylaminoimidazolesuccinocarboxamide synthase [Deltaproteobacteria bacterium RIFCSPLOWO2_01_
MKASEKIYEGKAKILYRTEDPNLLIQYFKDDATAFNAQKKGTIQNKGVVNCAVSSVIFEFLETKGIKTHFVKKLDDRQMLIKKVEIIPLEVVIRNYVAGSLAKRTGKPEGEKLPETLVEWYYKDDALGDPMVTKDHIRIFKLATNDEIAKVETLAKKVNDLLVPYFEQREILLVDYKLEFGRHPEGILLADEITPDGCRLWDAKTREKMDKDRFRFDLGKVEEGYKQIYERVVG